MNLQLFLEDRQRIDVDVGLNRTKDAIFGSYLHEWSLTKGKETKPPEQVYFWNSSLSHEIEAEVDLYIRHVFFERKKMATTVATFQAWIIWKPVFHRLE